MLRVLLTVLLPLLAPFLAYAAWVWLVEHKVKNGELELDWKNSPWPWLLAVGLLFSLAGLLYLYFTTGHPPGTKLAPPALVDGVVVPSHPAEQSQYGAAAAAGAVARPPRPRQAGSPRPGVPDRPLKGTA